MSKDQFVSVFLEGSRLSEGNSQALITNLIGLVYDLRNKQSALHSQIDTMDEVARDAGIQVKCRRCGEYYEIPCDLSEFSPEMSYCGSGHGGAYHCSP